MALAESLTTVDGETHAMAGVLRPTCECATGIRRSITSNFGRRGTRRRRRRAGSTLRGHEFHYSTAEIGTDARFAFDVERGTGIDGDNDGLIEHQTLGTYCHVHPRKGAFDAFLDGL